MYKKLLALTLCLAVLSGLAACGSAGGDEEDGGRLRVSVTFNALNEFVLAVGGDRVAVSTIIPEGMEPHDFEPKARDLADLREAQVFVHNGLGLTPWAEEAASAAGNDGLLVIDASVGIDLIPSGVGGESDPHIWLSLKCAQVEAANIRDALIAVDSENRAYYEQNCADFIAQLQTLYDEYYAKFAPAERKLLVTGHAAFAYFCRDFGLTQMSVRGVFDEGEPSAKQLAELVTFCRENSVKVVFAEELGSPEISRTLADEAGAQIETIYTIEGAENGRSYLERMAANLERIYSSVSD